MRFISSLTLLLLVVTGPHSLALASEPGSGIDSGATTSQSAESSGNGNDANDSSVPAEEPSSEEGATEGRETAEDTKEDGDETLGSSEDTTTESESESQGNPAPNNGVTITDDSDTRVIEIACDELVGDHTETFNDIESLTVSWSSSCDTPEATPTSGMIISEHDEQSAEVLPRTELAFTTQNGSLTVVFDDDTVTENAGNRGEPDNPSDPASSESDNTAEESSDDVALEEPDTATTESEAEANSEAQESGDDPANGITVVNSGLQRELYINCDEIVGTHDYVVTTDEVNTLGVTWHSSCAHRTVTPEDGLTNDGSGSVLWEVSVGAVVVFSRDDLSFHLLTISFEGDQSQGISDGLDGLRGASVSLFSGITTRASSDVVTVEEPWQGEISLKLECWRGAEGDNTFEFSPSDDRVTPTSKVYVQLVFADDCSSREFGTVSSSGELLSGGWTPSKYLNTYDLLEPDRWAKYSYFGDFGGNVGSVTIIFSDITAASEPRLEQPEPILATVGQPITPQPVVAADFSGDAPTFSAPNLPQGLVIDPQTGVISGNPEVLFAAENITITATNGDETATTTVEVTVNGYSISFDTKGNLDAPVGSVDSIEAFPGNEITLPAPGNASNHVFDGWYTDATEGERVGFGGDPYVPQASTTLFARWLPAVTITFRLEGGTMPAGFINPLRTAKGAEVLLPIPTKSNAGFDGWVRSPAHVGTLVGRGGETASAPEGFGDNLMVDWIAVWQQGPFNHRFNPGSPPGVSFGDAPCLNGDTNPCDIRWDNGIQLPDGRAVNVLPSPLAPGWRFDGWFTSASGGTKVGDGGDLLWGPSGGTFHAQWTQIRLNAPERIDVATGVAIEPWVPVPQGFSPIEFSITPSLPAGFSFDSATGTISGAATSDIGEDRQFEVTAQAPSGDSASVTVTLGEKPAPRILLSTYEVVLTAGEPITPITFTLGAAQSAELDGSLSLTTLTVDPALPAGIMGPDYMFNMPGCGDAWDYGFCGTPTTAGPPTVHTITGRTFDSAGGAEGTATLRISFVGFGHTVTFDPGSSELPVPDALSGGVGDVVSLPDGPTRPGWVFAGWFDQPSGGNRVGENGGYQIQGDATLYARWLEIFTITFNNHNNQQAMTMEVVDGDSFSWPTRPTRSGWNFSGWFGQPVGGSRLDTTFAFTPTSHMTLHAQWSRPPANIPAIPVRPGPESPSPEIVRPTPPATNVVAAPVFPREPLPPVTPAPPAQQTPVPTPTPAPTAPAPALPPRTADTGSVLQRNLEQPSGTVDFGSGVQSSGGATQGTPGATRPTIDVPVRTPGEKRAEVLQGFAPGSTTEIEVVGARTGARFVLSAQAASDKEQVAQAMASASTSSTTDFFEVRSVQAVSAPEPTPSWNVSERNAVSALFESSGLPAPKSLNDFDVSGFTEWVKIESEAKTYVPGTTVYLTVTSEPIVIGQAKVNASGEAELVGTIPAELLGAGEHRIRLIGIRLLDGVNVDEDGNVQVSDATMAEIQRFDQGTQVTVAVLGQNPEGEQHTALRIVALPEDARVSWWPLWLIVGAFALFVVARTRGLLGQPIPRSVGLGVVGASALPAIVIGVVGGVVALTWWGLAAGLLALGLAFFVPHRDPEAETA